MKSHSADFVATVKGRREDEEGEPGTGSVSWEAGRRGRWCERAKEEANGGKAMLRLSPQRPSAPGR